MSKKWISVKDSVPDTARSVLACNCGCMVIGCYSGGNWFGLSDCLFWMELPDFPS